MTTVVLLCGVVLWSSYLDSPAQRQLWEVCPVAETPHRSKALRVVLEGTEQGGGMLGEHHPESMEQTGGVRRKHLEGEVDSEEVTHKVAYTPSSPKPTAATTSGT